MQLFLLSVVLTLLAPTTSGSFVHKNHIPVEKTVTLANGQIVDWIKKDAQGLVASPPPFSPLAKPFREMELSILREQSAGPPGTVPVLRTSGVDFPKKVPPPTKKVSRVDRRQYANKHWYASTYQTINNVGTSGSVNVFKAYVQNNKDFSLLQTAVVRSGISGIGGTGLQSLEAGWINYPNQVAKPHLFTYFTTNGHGAYGNYISSWNLDYKGFIQSDTTYYPGIALEPLSIIDGNQYYISIQYKLYNGNWWLAVGGKWIGYYPGSLFARSGVSSASTLQTQSNRVYWYGEIYQSGASLTTTDMGSGKFASSGYMKSAYIRNVLVETTPNTYVNYDGSYGIGVDDTSRYTLDPHFKSGGSWASYFFLGGPGAGGVVGA